MLNVSRLSVEQRYRLIYKPALFIAGLTPAVLLTAGAFGVLGQNLGADPVARILHSCGKTALNFLLITLTVTPLKQLTGLTNLLRLRRMLGLFAFFYVCLHFLTYIGPDQSFVLSGMWKDVQKRRFITVGFLAFILLIPLAVTSTKGWIRRLGGKRWQTLHRSIYAAASCGVIHYYWLLKSDVRKPVFLGAIVAILLLWRLISWFLKRNRSSKLSTTPVLSS